jgi:exonuclease III
VNVLTKDLKKYNIDIACLQETRAETDIIKATAIPDPGTITSMGNADDAPVHQRYGPAFCISSRAAPSVWGTKRISNRISTLQIALRRSNNKSKPNFMTIVNAYAPTAMIAKDRPEETEKRFYDQLHTTIQQCKSAPSINFVAGDFNAKPGQTLGEDQHR